MAGNLNQDAARTLADIILTGALFEREAEFDLNFVLSPFQNSNAIGRLRAASERPNHFTSEPINYKISFQRAPLNMASIGCE